MKAIPALSMLTLLLLGTPAHAQLKTYNIQFEAYDFESINVPAPVDPVIGTFTVTLDPAVAVTESTANITLNSLNITLGSAISFSYDPAANGGYLVVGGIQSGTGLVQYSPSTSDFWLHIHDFATTPTFSQVGYSQASVSSNNLFYTLNQTGTVDVSEVTPSPCPIVSVMESSDELLGQAAEGAALVAANESMLRTIRRFRDEVLSRTPEGRELTALYYRHGFETSRILLTHPKLAAKSIDLLQRLTPALAECDGELAVDAALLAEGRELARSIADEGSEDLQASAARLDAFLQSRQVAVGNQTVRLDFGTAAVPAAKLAERRGHSPALLLAGLSGCVLAAGFRRRLFVRDA